MDYASPLAGFAVFGSFISMTQNGFGASLTNGGLAGLAGSAANYGASHSVSWVLRKKAGMNPRAAAFLGGLAGAPVGAFVGGELMKAGVGAGGMDVSRLHVSHQMASALIHTAAVTGISYGLQEQFGVPQPIADATGVAAGGPLSMAVIGGLGLNPLVQVPDSYRKEIADRNSGASAASVPGQMLLRDLLANAGYSADFGGGWHVGYQQLGGAKGVGLTLAQGGLTHLAMKKLTHGDIRAGMLYGAIATNVLNAAITGAQERGASGLLTGLASSAPSATAAIALHQWAGHVDAPEPAGALLAYWGATLADGLAQGVIHAVNKRPGGFTDGFAQSFRQSGEQLRDGVFNAISFYGYDNAGSYGYAAPNKFTYAISPYKSWQEIALFTNRQDVVAEGYWLAWRREWQHGFLPNTFLTGSVSRAGTSFTSAGAPASTP